MPDKVETLNIPGLDGLNKALNPSTFSLDAFEEAFLYFFKNCGSGNASVNQIGMNAPKLTVKQNLDLIKPEIHAKMPNYNKEMPVDGLKEGAARWMVEAHDRKPEDPVILFTHGGGYSLGLFPTFAYLCAEVYKRLNDKRLSIIVLDYTLATDGTYPRQLNDYVKTYNKLAESCNNIIIFGDSAGAHLAMTFMRHQNLEPYEGVEEACSETATGAILLSPWVHLHPSHAGGSYDKFKGKDVLSAEALCAFSEAVMPDGEYVYKNLNPSLDHVIWRDVIPEKVLVTMGGGEVLYDDIVTWTELAELDPDEVYDSQGAIHDDSTFWPRTSSITEKIVGYLEDVINSN